MRDKDGYTIKCEHCEWEIIDNRENKDFVCQKIGYGIYGKHLCYGDDNCRYYTPERRGNNEDGTGNGRTV